LTVVSTDEALGVDPATTELIQFTRGNLPLALAPPHDHGTFFNILIRPASRSDSLSQTIHVRDDFLGRNTEASHLLLSPDERVAHEPRVTPVIVEFLHLVRGEFRRTGDSG